MIGSNAVSKDTLIFGIDTKYSTETTRLSATQDSARTDSYQASLLASYGTTLLDHPLQFVIEIPYAQRVRSIEGLDLYITGQGLGDVSIAGRAAILQDRPFRAQHTVGIAAKFAMPTSALGADPVVFGSLANSDIWPGAGASVVSGGFWYLGNFKPLSIFADVGIFQPLHAGAGNLQAGTTLRMHTTAQFSPNEWLSLRFGVDGRAAGPLTRIDPNQKNEADVLEGTEGLDALGFAGISVKLGKTGEPLGNVGLLVTSWIPLIGLQGPMLSGAVQWEVF